MKEYALYKGDDFITIGTIKELAEYLKVKIETVRFYASKVYQRRTNGNGYVVVKLD